MRKYRCTMESVPGMYAQYEGSVDVWCAFDSSHANLFLAAVRELQRTSFPDRSASCWRMTAYEDITPKGTLP